MFGLENQVTYEIIFKDLAPRAVEGATGMSNLIDLTPLDRHEKIALCVEWG